MSHIEPHDPAQATGTVKEQFDAIRGRLGNVPNMIRVMGRSPVTLSAYLALSGALSDSPLSPRLRELVALAVSQVNGSEYCLAAHSIIAKGMGTCSTGDITAARYGESEDPREDAVLAFAQAVTEKRGHVSGADWDALRESGISDDEAEAIISEVTLNVFTNYLNNSVQTTVDYPAVPPLAR